MGRDTVSNVVAPVVKPITIEISGLDLMGTPWAHQREALRRSLPLRDFALLWDPGCGKSFAAIMVARAKMFHVEHPLRTIVVTPPIVIKNWKDEWLAHSKFKPEQILCLVGSGKERLEALKNADKTMVIVTNYQSLTVMPDVFAALKAWKPEIFICDEAHRVKNPQSKTCKRTAELAALAKHRMILSGTPILQSPMDLFGQYLVLDLGTTFGKNFYQFRAQYFYDKNAGMPAIRHFPNWQILPNAEKEIGRKIAATSMSAKKSECLDLPPFVRKVLSLELSSSQRRIYDEMAKDFVSYVGDKACVAKLAMTKALRLLQITSGFVTLEGKDGADREICSLEDNPRITLLSELLGDIEPSGKVIVWASFKQNYIQIAKACADADLAYVEVHGGISPGQKQVNVKLFQTDPRIRILIGNPGAGGIGINLIQAPSAVFYSRSFSLEHDIQAEARNYRGGSEIHDKVTRYDLVAENTIDEIVASRLAGKMAMSDSIFQELAREVAKTL